MHKNEKEVDVSLLREDVPEETDESGLFENAPRLDDGFVITDRVRGV